MRVAVLVVVAVLAAVLAFAATRPDTYSIARATTINAPPERIYPFIIDFREWRRWSSFEALDPAMTRTYTGAASGKGAVYEWQGNRQAGRGRMEITETSAPTKVTVTVDFAAPFEAHNVNRFMLDPQGGPTKIIWSMHGTQPYMLKVMGIFVSPDRLLGKHFETGLANLKAAAEATR